LNVSFAAGAAGGLLGTVGLGLVGALLGGAGASAQGKIIEDVGIQVLSGGMVGAVVGLLLGIAVGLHIARTRLEKQGHGTQLPMKRGKGTGPHP